MADMDPQCLNGSEPLPDAPASFEWNAAMLIDKLPEPLNRAATVAALIAGIPLGRQYTADFCQAEVLTDEPTDEDWLNVVNPLRNPFALASGAMERVMGSVKRQIWASYCHCKVGPPPEGVSALWSQTFGPYSIGSGSWSAVGLPEGAYIDELGSINATPTPNTSGTFQGNMDWDTIDEGLYRIGTIDGQTAVTYSLPEPTKTVAVDGVMAGTYVANVDGFTFTLYINGYYPEAPTYEPDEPFTGLPELPDPDECSLEEICEILRRLVLNTSVNVTFNQGDSYDVTDTRTYGEKAAKSSNRLERYLLPMTYPPEYTTDVLTGEGTANMGQEHVGFKVNVLSVPEGAGYSGVGVPAYYRIGYVQLSHAGGWGRKLPIVSDGTTYLDTGPGCSGMRYVLAEGVSITIQALGPDPEDD